MQKEIVRENAGQSSFKDSRECLRHLSIRIVESLITGFFLLDQLRLKLLEPFFLFCPDPLHCRNLLVFLLLNKFRIGEVLAYRFEQKARDILDLARSKLSLPPFLARVT